MWRLILVLCCLLMACTPAPTPGADLIYRTTQGGPVSTELTIWNANKSAVVNTIVTSTPGGIQGGFRWQLKPSGDNVQMEFTGRNDRVKVPPRGVVQLKVDGLYAFYGILPDPPSGRSPDAEAMLVLGGREALRRVLMDNVAYRDQGVYTIVRDILNRLCPPAVTYTNTLIGNGTGTDAGPLLSTYYAPTSDLSTVLEALAKSAGTEWGVDAQGRVFFGRPQPSALAVAYAGQPWRRLQVQGREAVTQAVVRIVTAPSEGVQGSTSDFVDGVPTRINYLPAAITSVATAPEHSLYRAQKAFDVPTGTALTVPGRYAITDSRDMTGQNNAVDSDPNTAATSTGLAPLLQSETASGRVVGARLTYTLSNKVRSAYLTVVHAPLAVAVPQDVLYLSLEPTTAVRTVTLIAPPSAYMMGKGVPLRGIAQVVVQGQADADPTSLLSVYDLEIFTVDEARAAEVAQSFVQVPYAQPAELRLAGLYTPTPQLTVTGTPDGDVSGPTSLWEYEHSPEQDMTTKVRLGATGTDPAIRALRWSVQQP